MAATAQMTDFTRDVYGRYICNSLEEAIASTDSAAWPGARPFDVIVLGGGSFAGVFAHHLFRMDAARRHRVLVLEGGPMLLAEHVQNVPMIGLTVPAATSISEMRAAGAPGDVTATGPRNEVWGLAWHSPVRFVGLAYCLGGRSLYWGGWAPRPLPDELAGWPDPVVADLAGDGGYPSAERQLGTDVPNDFLSGPLQDALRQLLYAAVEGGRVTGAPPLSVLPDHPAVAGRPMPKVAELAAMLGVEATHPDGPTDRQLLNMLKLEAPLAVQTRGRSGSFPSNKFSAVALLVEAARAAQAESADDDHLKRMMIVPQCHVMKLVVHGGRVTAVRTSRGDVTVPDDGVVVIGLGTIESTRLALNSFAGLPHSSAIGLGLTTNLRSNLTIRIPRAALPTGAHTTGLAEAALFVKGRHTSGNGRSSFFHLQITAAGFGPQRNASQAELWRSIPDIDTYPLLDSASDSALVVNVRGLGEMGQDNPISFVRLDDETDEYGIPRAFVQMRPTVRDLALWDAMDVAADDVAVTLANGSAYEVRGKDRWIPVSAGHPPSAVLAPNMRRDGLGTVHHEAGTLRVGGDPVTSAVDVNCRFHAVSNAYAVGPALFPHSGSANPMLTGTTLARRLAEHLARPTPYRADAGYTVLFDGTDTSRWRLAGSGDFALVDGALVAQPAADIGMAWCDIPTPPDFSLHLQFALSRPDDRSGVFLRFPNPDSKGYRNSAYFAVEFGLKAQIDDLARPDGADLHHTGAIHGMVDRNFLRIPCRPPGQWNDYAIKCRGQVYAVTLNGTQTTVVANSHRTRGRPSAPSRPTFIGLQSHTGRVAFRHIGIKAL